MPGIGPKGTDAEHHQTDQQQSQQYWGRSKKGDRNDQEQQSHKSSLRHNMSIYEIVKLQHVLVAPTSVIT